MLSTSPILTLRGLSLALLLLCGSLEAIAQSPLGVVVSVPPQRFLVEQIGGQEVSVSVMLAPGQSPATFEPTPRQLALVDAADLYYRIGVPFETAGMPRIRAINGDMRILDAREGIELLEMPDGHHHEESAHGHHHEEEEALDPHIWLSPPLLRHMAQRLAAELSELRPTAADYFSHNLAQLDSELQQLDQQLREILTPRKGSTLMVFHPSWGYFAREYGMTQVSIEVSGKAPGVKMLGAIIEQAQRNGVTRIYVQPQFDRKRAQTVAQAIGANVVEIDPLAENYKENLLRVARILAQK